MDRLSVVACRESDVDPLRSGGQADLGVHVQRLALFIEEREQSDVAVSLRLSERDFEPFAKQDYRFVSGEVAESRGAEGDAIRRLLDPFPLVHAT
jgi:hypothetical protein